MIKTYREYLNHFPRNFNLSFSCLDLQREKFGPHGTPEVNDVEVNRKVKNGQAKIPWKGHTTQHINRRNASNVVQKEWTTSLQKMATAS